jgi:hypothetical protein
MTSDHMKGKAMQSPTSDTTSKIPTLAVPTVLEKVTLEEAKLANMPRNVNIMDRARIFPDFFA